MAVGSPPLAYLQHRVTSSQPEWLEQQMLPIYYAKENYKSLLVSFIGMLFEHKNVVVESTVVSQSVSQQHHRVKERMAKLTRSPLLLKHASLSSMALAQRLMR